MRSVVYNTYVPISERVLDPMANLYKKKISQNLGYGITVQFRNHFALEVPVG